MALISASEARDFIPEITGEDTLLNTLIGAVGELFARRCGYPPASVGAAPTMESTSYTIDHDAIGGRDLDLRVYPATAIESVYDDLDQEFGADTLIASGDYAIASGGRLLRLKSSASHGAWSVGTECVRVTFTAGYATVPAGLKLLAKMAVKHLWMQRRTQGVASESSDGHSVSYQDTTRGLGEREDLPDFILAGLAQYRLTGALS